MLTRGLQPKRIIGIMVAGILVLSACGDDSDDGTDDETTPETEAPDNGDSNETSDFSSVSAWVAYGNDDLDEIPIYDEPDGDVVNTVDNPFSINEERGETSPAAFRVVSDVDDPRDEEWHLAELPIAPTNSTGYISGDDVEVWAVYHEITVDMDAMTLTLTERGDLIHEFPVGLGRDERATQPGEYFITELIESTDPAYGDFAYGINGFSEDPDVLADFPEGTIGIHGTSNPDSIGQRESSGCIRLNNDDIQAIQAAAIPLGTLVHVV